MEFSTNGSISKNYSLSPQSKRYFALDSAVFQYINNAGNRDNIKVVINFLDRKHVLPLNDKPIKTPVAESEVKVKVLNVCELYGSKLAALIGRCKARDIYDVYGLIEEVIDFYYMLRNHILSHFLRFRVTLSLHCVALTPRLLFI